MSGVAFASDKPIPVEQLPKEAKTFISTHFQNKKAVYAEKDWNSFECRLNDGTEIEFNKKGVWKKVDCNSQAIPAAIIPAAIQKYVKENFADSKITKIEKEGSGYEVGLSNDLDLKFNDKGKMIGMDD